VVVTKMITVLWDRMPFAWLRIPKVIGVWTGSYRNSYWSEVLCYFLYIGSTISCFCPCFVPVK
jgi:hypothetical protein